MTDVRIRATAGRRAGWGSVKARIPLQLKPDEQGHDTGGRSSMAPMSTVVSLANSALVAAGLAGVTAYLLARWQLGRSVTASKAAARLVYLEIAQNIEILDQSLKTGLSLLWVSAASWSIHQASVASLLREEAVARVAAPYTFLHAVDRFFAQSSLDLLSARVQGRDVEVLRQLRDLFVTAESTLRPVIWTGRRKRALGELLGAREWSVIRPPVYRRIAAGLGGISTGRVLAYLLAIWLISHDLDRIAKGIERKRSQHG